MGVKTSNFDRGTTERVEFNGYGTVYVRAVGFSVGLMLSGVVTITKRKDGLYSLYSPKCRGGNGRGVTGMNGGDLLTVFGSDTPLSLVFENARS